MASLSLAGAPANPVVILSSPRLSGPVIDAPLTLLLASLAAFGLAMLSAVAGIGGGVLLLPPDSLGSEPGGPSHLPVQPDGLGIHVDIRDQQTRRPDIYASDRYGASQKFGEEIRASGGAGLLYDSLRRRTGVNVVTHRPRNITDIVQTDHFEITVLARSRTIDVHRLSL